MSAATTPRLKVSREGIVLIKSFEGFRPRAVADGEGGWIIGYGHTASAREGLTVSEQDAELLLQYDLLPVVRALNDDVAAELNQHQFDALASFAISIGVDRFLASDVLGRLNAGDSGQAADALIGWPESAAPDSRLRRRAAERALFVADPTLDVRLSDLLAAPLPSFPAAPRPQPGAAPVVQPFSPASTSPASTPDARAAAVAALLGEDGVEPALRPTSPGFEPRNVRAETMTAVSVDRYSPYATPMTGPLPGFPPPGFPAAGAPSPVEPDPEPVPPTDPSTAAPAEDASPTPHPGPETPSAPTPVVPLVVGAPLPSPFPAMTPPLVLTPQPDFIESDRPVWSQEQRADPAVADDESRLFEDEPSSPVLHHEAEPARPRGFDWSQTGMYIFMGGLGLAACAFSAAAFRLASATPSPMGETTVVAWVLALIGAVCVGVSSWNLYVRWGRPG